MRCAVRCGGHVVRRQVSAGYDHFQVPWDAAEGFKLENNVVQFRCEDRGGWTQRIQGTKGFARYHEEWGHLESEEARTWTRPRAGISGIC